MLVFLKVDYRLRAEILRDILLNLEVDFNAGGLKSSSNFNSYSPSFFFLVPEYPFLKIVLGHMKKSLANEFRVQISFSIHQQYKYLLLKMNEKLFPSPSHRLSASSVA